MRLRSLSLLCAAIVCLWPAHADEPFRLEDAVDAPDWLTLKGEARVRYESLDGQFRAGREGSDQLLLFRTLFLAEADTGPLSLGLELQDSRTYLADEGTPLSSSITNPLDILQLYLRADDLPGLLGEGSTSALTLGRQTVSIGSKRQIDRADFANVIKSYTGAHLVSEAAHGDELHIIYVVPTARFPNQRPALDDNELSGDEEQWERRVWGAHYRRANLLGERVPGLWGEAYVYGLDERDTANFQTPDRSYVAPGVRLFREKQVGQWDVDLEVSRRTGTRYASSAPTDTQSLEVEADMAFLALGYTFDAPWQPRIAYEHYYVSGDEDPDDLRYGQHERLFGSRRSDLNNTSIHGPLTPANLNAPGFKLEVTPNARWDGRFYYHAAFLASETDSWVIAGLRDPTGQSGDFIGHTLDGRARYWIVPDSLRFEIGASALIYGEFAKAVPDGPQGDGTLYGYLQLTFRY